MSREEENVVLDSLPYVDKEYESKRARAEVRMLIDQEMRTFEPKVYLEYLPLPEESIAALERFETSGDDKSESKVDMSRYSWDFFDDESKSVDERVARAKILAQNLSMKLLNLELLKKYGSQLWRSRNIATENIHTRLVESLKDVEKSINDVNVERKKSQVKAISEIQDLEARWWNLVYKNKEIEGECLKLEKHIAWLRTKLKGNPEL